MVISWWLYGANDDFMVLYGGKLWSYGDFVVKIVILWLFIMQNWWFYGDL